MDDGVKQVLADLVRRDGTSVAEDPRRCVALLKDLCPGRRAEVNVLTAALNDGVARELSQLPPSVSTEATIARLKERLAQDLALEEHAAGWAVEAWATALGLDFVPSSPDQPPPDPPSIWLSVPPPSAAPSPPPVTSPSASSPPGAADLARQLGGMVGAWWQQQRQQAASRAQQGPATYAYWFALLDHQRRLRHRPRVGLLSWWVRAYGLTLWGLPALVLLSGERALMLPILLVACVPLLGFIVPAERRVARAKQEVATAWAQGRAEDAWSAYDAASRAVDLCLGRFLGWTCLAVVLLVVLLVLLAVCVSST